MAVIRNVVARHRTTYKGFTIEYYKEVFGHWTGKVLETWETDDVIQRSGITEEKLLERVRESIDIRLVNGTLQLEFNDAVQRWLQ